MRRSNLRWNHLISPVAQFHKPWLFIDRQPPSLHSPSVCVSLSHAVFTLQPVGGVAFSVLPAQQETERGVRERDGEGSEELTDELALPHCLCFPQQVHVAGEQRYINCLACLWEKNGTIWLKEKKQLVLMRQVYPFVYCMYRDINY